MLYELLNLTALVGPVLADCKCCENNEKVDTQVWKGWFRCFECPWCCEHVKLEHNSPRTQ